MPDFYKLGDYLATVDQDLWVWDEKAEAVQWATGLTIGFREEFIAVIERLSQGGLPPFGAIVLLMAACRNEPSGWKTTDRYEKTISQELKSLFLHLRRINVKVQHPRLLLGLEAVHELPECFRTPLKAKVALVHEILGSVKDRDRPREIPDCFVAVHQRVFSPVTSRRGIDALAEGLSRFDAKTWPTRFRTGVDETPAAAEELLLPPNAPAVAETVRRLIEELQQDRELSSVAAAARHLLAVAHLPRPMGSREQLPIGGVSDVSNRGSLHQLLTAELANDDFTLAMRITQGEALYLRREDPPTPPPGDRVIVIDAGLRMWGVPRVFAASVGLALAATTARNGEWKAFRVEGDERFPIDFGCREGLLQHLERLSPSLSPMPAFQEIYREAAKEAVREIVLIAAEETTVDPEFVADLPTERGPTLFVASVSRSGEFKLREPRKRGSEPIAVAQLDVSSLATVNRRPLDVKTASRLPPIFAERPFPLLFSCQPHCRHAVKHPAGGIAGLVGNGRLMHWPDPKWGAVELAAHTGRGDIRCLGATPEGTIVVVRWRSADLPLTMIAAHPNGDVKVSELGLHPGRPPIVFLRGGHLFVASTEAVTAYDPHEGRMEARLPLNDVSTKSWSHGFLYHRGDSTQLGRWFFPSVEHGRLKLVPALDEDVYFGSQVVGVFQPPGREEIIALDGAGDYWTDSHGYWKLGLSRDSLYYLGSISWDGRYSEIVEVGGKTRRFLVDHDLRAAFERKVPAMHIGIPHYSFPSYRTRIRGIAFGADGALILSTPKGYFEQKLVGSEAKWIKRWTDPTRTTLFSGGTESVRGDARAMPRVRLTESREVILDRRGLLHLFDSSGELSDVTITLFTGNANAAWSSRLGSVGNPFCFGERLPFPNDWTPFFEAIAKFGEGR